MRIFSHRNNHELMSEIGLTSAVDGTLTECIEPTPKHQYWSRTSRPRWCVRAGRRLWRIKLAWLRAETRSRPFREMEIRGSGCMHECAIRNRLVIDVSAQKRLFLCALSFWRNKKKGRENPTFEEAVFSACEIPKCNLIADFSARTFVGTHLGTKCPKWRKEEWPWRPTHPY